MDSNRVLVLEHGELAEFAPPAELIAKGDGLFHSLVHADGPVEAKRLTAMANGGGGEERRECASGGGLN
jgi:hypothetical protein